MATFWNGSGSVVRTDGTRTGSGVWAAAKAASIKILSSAHDTHDQGLADSIQACIAKNGENAATANLPMGTFRHTGVGNASARNHYAAAGQIQDSSLTWGGTAGGTVDALTVTLTPAITAYVTGMGIALATAGTNTVTDPTIAVNGLAAKTIKKADGNSLVEGELVGIIELRYDGTDFIILSPLSPSTQVALNGNTTLVSENANAWTSAVSETRTFKTGEIILVMGIANVSSGGTGSNVEVRLTKGGSLIGYEYRNEAFGTITSGYQNVVNLVTADTSAGGSVTYALQYRKGSGSASAAYLIKPQIILVPFTPI